MGAIIGQIIFLPCEALMVGYLVVYVGVTASAFDIEDIYQRLGKCPVIFKNRIETELHGYLP